MQKYCQKDVRILTEKSVRDGFLSIHQVTLQHRLFAGGWSPVFQREVMERGNAVVVVPYDPVKDTLVVLEQFRIGAMKGEESPWLLEFVAGMYDSVHESAEQVAHRELAEEAGLTTTQLHYALNYLSTPGGCTERMTIFVALVDSDSAATHGGLASEHEDIRVHVVPFTEAVQLLERGKINNAASVIGLQWLQLHKHRFKQA
ncbi:ADP-ribose pyrophosphatase [Pseudidiomarina indica]|uniref:ADP-ribose pyrophosphatase n=1 Tax=Pseudidiomarina indica TaxID=1159017 RepID=A0A1G6B2J8_9GAMM|nr:NUDIX domain-containing protein [Pseudidiomarina indica]SDB14888.1 ADP-ribose pyrophosphatase [Pseudidiomarina indica]